MTHPLHFTTLSYIMSDDNSLYQFLYLPIVNTLSIFREVDADLVFLSSVIDDGGGLGLAVDLLHRWLCIVLVFQFHYIDAALGFQHHVDSAIRCRHLWGNVTAQN